MPPRPEVLAVLVLLALINVGMIVGRMWSDAIGVAIGVTPVVLALGGLLADRLARRRRRWPAPLPRATVVRS